MRKRMRRFGRATWARTCSAADYSITATISINSDPFDPHLLLALDIVNHLAYTMCSFMNAEDKSDGFNQYYDEAVEPGKRERAYAWATAIGLQDVDGLKPSRHLLATARRHIEGEITQEDARRIVDEYYETKDGHDLPRDTEEADKVSARIVEVINSPSFVFSPAYLIGFVRETRERRLFSR